MLNGFRGPMCVKMRPSNISAQFQFRTDLNGTEQCNHVRSVINGTP